MPAKSTPDQKELIGSETEAELTFWEKFKPQFDLFKEITRYQIIGGGGALTFLFTAVPEMQIGQLPIAAVSALFLLLALYQAIEFFFRSIELITSEYHDTNTTFATEKALVKFYRNVLRGWSTLIVGVITAVAAVSLPIFAPELASNNWFADLLET